MVSLLNYHSPHVVEIVLRCRAIPEYCLNSQSFPWQIVVVNFPSSICIIYSKYVSSIIWKSERELIETTFEIHYPTIIEQSNFAFKNPLMKSRPRGELSLRRIASRRTVVASNCRCVKLSRVELSCVELSLRPTVARRTVRVELSAANCLASNCRAPIPPIYMLGSL